MNFKRVVKPFTPATGTVLPADGVVLKEHCVEELADFCMPLHQLQTRVAQLVEQYGRDALIKVSAGYNNVEVIIEE